MLLVRQVPHQLLNVDRVALAVQMLLGVQTAGIDQSVSISNDTGDRGKDMIIHLVELATLTSLNKQTGGFFLFASDDNS